MSQGVSLPPSFVALQGVSLLSLYCSGCDAAAPIQSLAGCVADTLPCTGVHPITIVPFAAEDYSHSVSPLHYAVGIEMKLLIASRNFSLWNIHSLVRHNQVRRDFHFIVFIFHFLFFFFCPPP